MTDTEIDKMVERWIPDNHKFDHKQAAFNFCDEFRNALRNTGGISEDIQRPLAALLLAVYRRGLHDEHDAA